MRFVVKLGLSVLASVGAFAQVPDNLTITSSTAPPFTANQTITTSGTVTVNGAAGTVVYQAGTQIRLTPGFRAVGVSGVAFDARISVPTVTLTSAATPTVAIGQSTPFVVTATALFGFAGTVTMASSGMPAGLSAVFSPSAVTFSSGSSAPVAVTVTLSALANSTVGSGSFTVSGGGQAVAIPFTVTAKALPVISLESPATGGSVFGGVDLKGYAVANTPAIAGSGISSVGISIVSNDGGISMPVTGLAAYGLVRADLCGAGKLFPAGTPGCPGIGFDYLWNTGLAADGVSFAPNGIYTATVTAADNGTPSGAKSASAVYTVDNQPPSPLMGTPVNGDGDYHTSQTFVVNFVSPHGWQDIGSGQIVFEQSPTLECTVLWQVGGTITMAGGSQACVINGNAMMTKISNNGINQVSVQVTLMFPPAMQGQVSVLAYGTDQQGLAGPLTELTKFTVTGTPAPMLLTSGAGSFSMVPGELTLGTQTALLLNGATGPVTVGAPTVYSQFCPSIFAGLGVSNDPVGKTATISAYSYGSGNSCAFATFPLYAPGMASTLDAFYFGTSTIPFFNVSTPSTIYMANQGTVLTVPVTFVPKLGYAGAVNLAVAPPGGIVGTWTPGTLSLDGTNAATATLNLAVDRGLARGTYAVLIPGGGNQYYFYVTVTPNVVPDFTIGPLTQVNVSAGTPVSFMAQVSPVGGFAGAVTWSSAGIPDQIGIPGSAISMTFAPPVSGALSGGTQTMTGTLRTTAVTANGTYLVPVTAQSGGVARTVMLPVQVRGGTGPDFRMVGPVSIIVHPGVPGISSFFFQPVAGFSGPVTLSQLSSPAGLTGVLNPASVSLSGTSASTATISVSAPAGVTNATYTLSVTGSGGEVTHTVQIAVTVSPTPSISLSLPSAFQSVQIGQSSTFVATVSTQNYTAGSITISATALPFGVAMLPAVIPSGATTAKITLTASADATPNRYSFYLGASDGGVTSSVVSVILTIPNFVITPTLVRPLSPGGNATLTASVKAVGAYSGLVNVAYSAGSGFSVSGPASVMPGGSLTAVVTALAGATEMSYPTLTATDSSGLSATIPVGAFFTLGNTGNWCGGLVFRDWLGPNPDPYTTGRFGATLTAGIAPDPNHVAGWTSQISNARVEYTRGVLISQADGTYRGGSVVDLVAANAGPVTSSSTETISLSVPGSGGGGYRGAGPYNTLATFK